MKIKCDFCQTEYTVPRTAHGAVRCALCGHTWNVVNMGRVNAWLVMISAICALLAAGIFVAAVIARSRIDAATVGPLTPKVSEIAWQNGDDAAPQMVVRGSITNNTSDIYGVPDLIITLRDAHDHVLGRQKFMPTATLIEGGATIQFDYRLAPVMGVKRISVELAGE